MKYAVGTKWIITNLQTGEEFEGEVIDKKDPRVQKFKTPSDVVMFYPSMNWGTTYDAEFLDECSRPDSIPTVTFNPNLNPPSNGDEA